MYKRQGIAERVMEQVENAGVKAVVFDGVIPNPTNEVVEEAAVIAKEAQVDGFVAVSYTHLDVYKRQVL